MMLDEIPPGPTDDDAPPEAFRDGDNVLPFTLTTSSGRPRAKRAARSRTSFGDWRDRLLSKPDGTLDACGANAITIFTSDPAWEGLLSWDEFSQSLITTRPPPWDDDDAPAMIEKGSWSDADTIRAQSWLQRRHGLKLGKDSVLDAIIVAAERSASHPVRDWLDGLEWDAVARCDTWLTTYLGVPDTPYSMLVGRCFLVAAVARVYRPGCQVDTMLILEGDQGIRKSSVLRVLFDPWFSDTPLDLQSKDRFVGLRGVWGHEVAELDSFGKADSARIKSFVTSRVDDYRPPYGRSTVRVPRRCVFAGTVNPDGLGYFRDTTGNRRMLPVKCGLTGPIDHSRLERDRKALFAEARERFQGGLLWWAETPEEKALFSVEQEARMVSGDAWDGLVARYLAGRLGLDTHVTVADILTHLGLEKGRWGQVEQNRAARALVASGWERCQYREDGVRVWGYQRKRVVTCGDGSGDAQ